MNAAISNRALATLILILLMLIITMLGMAYNVKTVALSGEIQEIKKEITKLKEENTRLLEEHLQKSTLDNIERIASKNLKMIPNKKIIYYTNLPEPQ